MQLTFDNPKISRFRPNLTLLFVLSFWQLAFVNIGDGGNHFRLLKFISPRKNGLCKFDKRSTATNDGRDDDQVSWHARKEPMTLRLRISTNWPAPRPTFSAASCVHQPSPVWILSAHFLLHG